MKEAYIVGIVSRTRVVVNVTEGMTQDEINEIAINQAVKKILSDPAGYLDADNCIEVDPDEECPAGTFQAD